MKPRPLDLEEISVFKILDKKGLIGYGGTLKISKIGGWGFIDKSIRKELKQRIKSACEFYLRYKDKPELLMKEHPEYKKEVENIKWIPNPYFEECKQFAVAIVEEKDREYYRNGSCKYCPVRDKCQQGEYIYNDEFIKDYNEWLFKLAFMSFEEK